MSPHVCATCFLFETRGVCPRATSEYGLETPAYVLARAEVLRAAIEQDAHAARTLFQLIRSDAARLDDARRQRGGPRALPAAPESNTNEQQKEKIDVISSRTV
jgi:hypothetical protein